MVRKRNHHKLETRVVRVEEPTDPRGLYRVYYQQFRGNMPVELPYPADMTKLQYELLTLRWILIGEFKVPEHFVDKVIDKVREVEQEAESFRD
jgi:hypothetical protein